MTMDTEPGGELPGGPPCWRPEPHGPHPAFSAAGTGGSGVAVGQYRCPGREAGSGEAPRRIETVAVALAEKGRRLAELMRVWKGEHPEHPPEEYDAAFAAAAGGLSGEPGPWLIDTTEEAGGGAVTLDSTRPVNDRTTLHTVDVEPVPAATADTRAVDEA